MSEAGGWKKRRIKAKDKNTKGQKILSHRKKQTKEEGKRPYIRDKKKSHKTKKKRERKETSRL